MYNESSIKIIEKKEGRHKENVIFLNNLSNQRISCVRKFHHSIKDMEVSPLVSLKNLALFLGVKGIYIKDENRRCSLNSFKVLGASYAIAQIICKRLSIDINSIGFEDLKKEQIRKEMGNITFVTCSDGNHGRAVAWTAKEIGCEAVVYLPKGTVSSRVEAIRALGAKAEVTDLNYDDTVRYALKKSQEKGYEMVQDTAWDGYYDVPQFIIQGYAAMAMEAFDQLKELNIEAPTHMFLQAGVGAMAGGALGCAVNYYKDKYPFTCIVEPNNAACIYKSFEVGDGKAHKVEGDLNSIMAGLSCGEPNPIGLNIINCFADACISCEDSIAARGMRLLASPLGNDEKIISGESGGVTLGLISKILMDKNLSQIKEKLNLNSDSVILLFSTEGATDPVNYTNIVKNGKYLTVGEELLKAESYKEEMTAFLRDMIRIPSESKNEKDVIIRIKDEMDKVGFDKVSIDPMGNVLGYLGHGKHLIAMDAHIDTVGVGDIKLWTSDPYEGYEDDKVIYGRGGSDQEGGMAAMVYAGKIIKDLNLKDDYTLLVTGTVQEEDCDGLCYQYIVNEDKIKPEFVVITEPTSCRIYRGHRGRMEIKVVTHGISCHGSAPERGENAIFKMAPILLELQELNNRLKVDDFLGKGTLTVSQIYFSSPSRCAVADECTISIDRRLTAGETYEMAINEIQNLPSVKKFNGEVSMYDYAEPSYTGLVYPTKAFFPSWVLSEDHVAVKTAIKTYKDLFNEEPIVDKWTFSTNGVSIMGRFNIPCVGFGPGHEDQAHAPNEKTYKDELVKAAAMYAAIPKTYLKYL